MRMLHGIWVFLFFTACNTREANSQRAITKEEIDSARYHVYSWKASFPLTNKVVNRIAAPEGYRRISVDSGSFADWLRHLPLKEGRPAVFLYNGHKKFNQHAQHAVLDIDTGDKDLQQCADAVMRLRAEYLYATGQHDKIQFHFTSGFLCDYDTWRKGFRPHVQGNSVSWKKKSDPDRTYASFKKYMETIFMYCGTHSLSKEMRSKDLVNIFPGDVFIQGGFPGHAVIVIEVAIHQTSGKRIFLLAQSYMPAQDMHILVNPDDSALSPWYSNEVDTKINTPEWTFQKKDLKQF